MAVEAHASYNQVASVAVPDGELAMNWRERITVDPAVCHGKACIKGTRVMASIVLDNLAAGETPEAIAAAYHIERDDIQAALLYAAELAKERVVPLAVGAR
jgi:uncharacterized protein (DUF433 family)